MLCLDWLFKTGNAIVQMSGQYENISSKSKYNNFSILKWQEKRLQ